MTDVNIANDYIPLNTISPFDPTKAAGLTPTVSTYPAPTTTTGTVTANTGTTNTANTQNLTQYMANQVSDPTLANNAVLTPVLQSSDTASLQNSGQLLNASNQNTVQDNSNLGYQANQVQGATTNSADPLSQINPAAATYSAANANAAQGTTQAQQVNPLDTVQGQLTSLYSQMTPGQTPAWAQGAVNTANQQMAARGISVNSTISQMALYGAVQNSATNIAAADAATYFQANTNSYNAQQQMNLQNVQNYQQSLLSNQAAQNASLQFNASSTAQTQQFMSNMVSTINDQNANRIQAADTSNQNAQNAASQFDAQQQYQRQQFNAQNQFAIDQSNVQWRRQINTANTAAVNAANQVNVQNAFNLSTTALNNLWQQFNDEASWAFTASEDQQNRDYNLAIISNNQSFVSNQSNTSWTSELGALAASLLFSK